MNKYKQYEIEKAALRNKGLTPKEYEQAIKKIARKLKI